jgi:hypothetical protein
MKYLILSICLFLSNFNIFASNLENVEETKISAHKPLNGEKPEQFALRLISHMSFDDAVQKASSLKTEYKALKKKQFLGKVLDILSDLRPKNLEDELTDLEIKRKEQFAILSNSFTKLKQMLALTPYTKMSEVPNDERFSIIREESKNVSHKKKSYLETKEKIDRIVDEFIKRREKLMLTVESHRSQDEKENQDPNLQGSKTQTPQDLLEQVSSPSIIQNQKKAAEFNIKNAGNGENQKPSKNSQTEGNLLGSLLTDLNQ